VTGRPVEGWLFGAGRSAVLPVVLQVDAGGFATAVDRKGVPVRTFNWAEARVDDRIGNTRRRVMLPDGAAIEVDDNDAIDALERAFGRGRATRWIAALERRWPAALSAIVFTFAVTWSLIAFGLPFVGDLVASRIPPSYAAKLDAQVLDTLARMGSASTAIPEARRREVQRLLERLIAGVPDRGVWHYRLVFRGGLGANAFALPGGTIVVTDRLIRIAKSDNQVAAVLAHEIGHVERRHALKKLMRNAGLGALALYLFGDVTSLSHVAVSFPLLVIDAAYSRDFEREADAAAVDYLSRAGFPPQAMIEVLDLLARDCGAGCEGPGFLMNHPMTPERIAALRDIIARR
jgi:predicted Zn-dependent protease